MATTTAETEAPSKWADSKSAWKRRAVHDITLDSGQKVRVKFPDTTVLFQQDALPRNLIHVAFMDQFAPGEISKVVGNADQESELLRDYLDLGDRLAHAMLVDPKLTLEELRQVPQEDLDMLRQIAMRQRDTDARGVRLGVVPLDVFTTFREAHEGSEVVADGHPPFPDPGCELCFNAMREFSSLRELLL